MCFCATREGCCTCSPSAPGWCPDRRWLRCDSARIAGGGNSVGQFAAAADQGAVQGPGSHRRAVQRRHRAAQGQSGQGDEAGGRPWPVEKPSWPTLSEAVAAIASQAYMTGPVDSFTTLVSATDDHRPAGRADRDGPVRHHPAPGIEAFNTLQQQYGTTKMQLDNVIATENAERINLTDAEEDHHRQAQQALPGAQEALRLGDRDQRCAATRPRRTSRAAAARSSGSRTRSSASRTAGRTDGPGSYDCSGLTLAAYRTVGVTLYHKAIGPVDRGLAPVPQRAASPVTWSSTAG